MSVAAAGSTVSPAAHASPMLQVRMPVLNDTSPQRPGEWTNGSNSGPLVRLSP
jgi:hypothetical protein